MGKLKLQYDKLDKAYKRDAQIFRQELNKRDEEQDKDRLVHDRELHKIRQQGLNVRE